MALVAQQEREAISRRQGARSEERRLSGLYPDRGEWRQRAQGQKHHGARAADLAPIIMRLDPNGSLSLRALAAKLTAEGLPTPAGARRVDRSGCCACQGEAGRVGGPTRCSREDFIAPYICDFSITRG